MLTRHKGECIAQINIIYWSGTGNAESMAEYIKQGAEGVGATVTVKNVSGASIADSLIVNEAPEGSECKTFGEEIAKQ